MKNREKILMQKIAKREKVKKKLNVKATKVETAEIKGEKLLTFSIVYSKFNSIFCFHPLAGNNKVKAFSPEKIKKQKLVTKPEKIVKKKKEQKKIPEPESSEDEEMEQQSDDEEVNGKQDEERELFINDNKSIPFTFNFPF